MGLSPGGGGDGAGGGGGETMGGGRESGSEVGSAPAPDVGVGWSSIELLLGNVMLGSVIVALVVWRRETPTAVPMITARKTMNTRTTTMMPLLVR